MQLLHLFLTYWVFSYMMQQRFISEQPKQQSFTAICTIWKPQKKHNRYRLQHEWHVLHPVTKRLISYFSAESGRSLRVGSTSCYKEKEEFYNLVYAKSGQTSEDMTYTTVNSHSTALFDQEFIAFTYYHKKQTWLVRKQPKLNCNKAIKTNSVLHCNTKTRAWVHSSSDNLWFVLYRRSNLGQT